MMAGRFIAWCLIGGLVFAACGDREGRESGGSAGAPVEASAAVRSNMIGADALAACAGFTADKAASLLGMPPGSIKDSSSDVGASRHCVFTNPESRGASIFFTLSAKDSVQEAEASLDSERQSMAQAQRAIDSVTGSAANAPASQDVATLGDGAFYSPMNGAIMMRVANVMAQIAAPEDISLKQRVAQEVAAGLRP